MPEKEPQPKGYHAKINYGIIAAICAGAILYQVYAYLYPNYVIKNFTILDIPWILNPLGIGIAAIIIAKKYWDYSDVLGKAYLSLGIGFLLYLAGSSTYEYYTDFENQIGYPSLADVFFLASYPFLYYHLLRNIKHWASKIDLRIKIGLIVLGCAMIISFTYLTYSQLSEPKTFGLEFFTSETYVACDAAQLSLVILGAMVFRRNKLRSVWLLLVTGFLIYTISDYWYYYDSSNYNEIHPVNALFQLGFMIIIYALYMHKKVV